MAKALKAIKAHGLYAREAAGGRIELMTKTGAVYDTITIVDGADGVKVVSGGITDTLYSWLGY